MKARQHTSSMLRWWWRAGITLADLAVRRRDGSMIWHHETPLANLPLAWARAENARQAEIYIRPARDHTWPLVLLDDVPVATATRVARKYGSFVVHTSPRGGCHLWLSCSEALDEGQRCRAQRWLAQKVDADPASISGEHLGRLAGFKNWKRAGAWVNALHGPHRDRPWIPQLVTSNGHEKTAFSPVQHRPAGVTDKSASGREWGWICGLLEAGCDPTTAYNYLVEQASSRHRRDAERYAHRTVERAQSYVGLHSTGEPRERELTYMPS